MILHDTNSHSGPVVLMKAINQEYFSIEVFFREFEDDYGMACATRIKK